VPAQCERRGQEGLEGAPEDAAVGEVVIAWLVWCSMPLLQEPVERGGEQNGDQVGSRWGNTLSWHGRLSEGARDSFRDPAHRCISDG
jgi:hypothetical protein